MSHSPPSVAPRMSTLRLRPWQRIAFDAFTASPQPDFLAVATPGAGKTTFALTCARWALAAAQATGERRRLVVVAPTSHLKMQWAIAAHRVGLELDPDWSPAGGIAKDVHGIVTTYQQVATGATADTLRGIAADAFVVLDEIHHAGDERAWGDSVRRAFELAERRLCLSGTPFRSDTAAIPFVRYEHDEAQPDISYGYAEALRDGGVVRPVYFPRVDGLMEWSAPDGTVLSATFQDELGRGNTAQRLRTALSLDGDWITSVLLQAQQRLDHMRATHPDAAGLVIATDQDHAHGIARVMRRRLGVEAEVVVSDDPSASRKIADFAASDAPWLVAVRMVSEGVDIPRLRVGVYATTVSTELFFRQAVGRFVRWQHGRASQKAYVFIPDDPRLRAHAFQIAEARRHVLRPPSTDDDAEATGRPEHDAPFDEVPAEQMPEQLSLFSVLSAVATDMRIHAVTEEGLLFDDEPEVPEPVFDDDPDLAVDIPDVTTEAGWAPDGRRSVAEIKDELRRANADVALRLVDLTGWSHARVNGEMNRLANVQSVSSATIGQLERRLHQGRTWLERVRGSRAR